MICKVVYCIEHILYNGAFFYLVQITQVLIRLPGMSQVMALNSKVNLHFALQVMPCCVVWCALVCWMRTRWSWITCWVCGRKISWSVASRHRSSSWVWPNPSTMPVSSSDRDTSGLSADYLVLGRRMLECFDRLPWILLIVLVSHISSCFLYDLHKFWLCYMVQVLNLLFTYLVLGTVGLGLQYPNHEVVPLCLTMHLGC